MFLESDLDDDMMIKAQPNAALIVSDITRDEVGFIRRCRSLPR
jgi:hypothetical protein